jgi:hypothetical protein
MKSTYGRESHLRMLGGVLTEMARPCSTALRLRVARFSVQCDFNPAIGVERKNVLEPGFWLHPPLQRDP